MPSRACESGRRIVFLLLMWGFLILSGFSVVLAQAPPPPPSGGGTGDDLEAAERIRVLEAQRIRQDERASLWGGTGIVFTRTAILLPRKHLNLSTYFDYAHYQYIQGWREAYKLDDPRKNDTDMFIVVDYGATHWMEVDLFMDMFLQNERNDPQQLHMRTAGLAWSGLSAKFRLMDIDKDGLGISTTFFTRFPSPDSNSLLTSRDVGFGAELNMSLKCVVIADWLEKWSIHGNLGYAYMDYFDTGLAGLYQFAKSSKDFNFIQQIAKNGDEYRKGNHGYKYKDLWDKNWKKLDDIQMKYPYFMAEHYTGSFAVEVKPMLGVSTGVELVGYRMLDFSDDNLQLAPFLTYTFRQMPFSSQVRKDLLTISAAGNIGVRSLNRSAPQWGILAGLTWHTDLIF